jgi:hypothetical protein
MYMKGAVAALALAGTMLLTTGAAEAQYYHHRHHHHNPGLLGLVFGDVAYGYNDGYWDNGHQWHRWNNDADFHNYRDHGTNYHAWQHDRDGDLGWQRH